MYIKCVLVAFVDMIIACLVDNGDGGSGVLNGLFCTTLTVVLLLHI